MPMKTFIGCTPVRRDYLRCCEGSKLLCRGAHLSTTIITVILAEFDLNNQSIAS